MLFRGRRVLHSRIPLRHITNKKEEQTIENSSQHQAANANEGREEKRNDENRTDSDEGVADCMQIQMAFYAIPKELLMNSDGEVLDSRETILWEGYLFRRVC